MQLKQKVTIPVSQQLVWDSLNDPAVLKASLPGCQEFTAREASQDDSREFDVVVTAKVGPVKATFKGEVTLSHVVPPISYRISGNGKGGVAGFAKGGAEVMLAPAEDDKATVLTYAVDASVGGRLAQLGSRLVLGAARKMADDFFANFVRLVSGDDTLAPKVESQRESSEEEAPKIEGSED